MPVGYIRKYLMASSKPIKCTNENYTSIRLVIEWAGVIVNSDFTSGGRGRNGAGVYAANLMRYLQYAKNNTK